MYSRVLYQAPQAEFIKDVEKNVVFQKMQYNAQQCGIHTAENEIASWTNNAPHISTLLLASGVNDSYVTFEFLVPFSRKRIDCMIYGKDENNNENAIHIELKQWSNNSVKVSDSDGNFTTDEVVFNVEAFTGHANRIVAHPSQQVKGYQGYLSNFIEVFSKQEVTLTGLAYCYNYLKSDPKNRSYLFDEKYDKLLSQFPTFGKDQKSELAEKLGELLKGGDGLSVFNKTMKSPIRPSKKLLNEVSKMIEAGDTSAFSLLEDQIVARNMILNKIRHLNNEKDKKSVIIVNGGPGTGKTVIALHILAELAKTTIDGHGLTVFYSTKSASLLGGLRYQFQKKKTADILLQNLTSFYPADFDVNGVDVLLVDESHRIEKTSNSQYTPSHKRTDMPQVDTLIRASKITVFFIDNKQAIRGKEIGSSELIKESASRWNANIEECTLTSQFRCNGSDNYLDWIEQVLYNKPITSTFDASDYELKLYDDIESMYKKIVEQDDVQDQSARLMAGFCWKWTDHLNENGNLVKDVVIEESGKTFEIPWETHRSIPKPPEGYVKWYEWAYRPEGIKQCGCIYTAQGFEFDYAGVIIGEDLQYDDVNKKIITVKAKSKDPVLLRGQNGENMSFDDYVRNIYRVLLSRGMKGCYLYIVDKKLREHFRQLLNQNKNGNAE